MKNLLIACLATLVPFLASAQEKITRAVSPFDKIVISGGFKKVSLQKADAESVAIEGSGALNDIVTEVSDNTLLLSAKQNADNDRNTSITIYYRSVKGLTNNGSSNIEMLNAIQGETFKLASNGSGDFTGELAVNELDLALSGSGDITLKGKAAVQHIAVLGSGDVNASSLSGDEARVALSGSGDVKLGVKGDDVKTAVSGSGTVSRM